MQKCKRMVCAGLALLLIFCIAPLPAFAYAKEETTATDPTAATEPEVQAEKAYSYTVSEDGSITVTVDGEKWVFNTTETITTGTVVTQGSCLNLRTGAGLQYDIIDHLSPGTEVTVVETVGDWYKVTIPGKTGYVHSDYLKVVESTTGDSGVNAELMELLLTLILSNGTTSSGAEESQPTLTPEGNLSLVDDILQKKVFTTEEGELEEKQFVTLQSKNGNTFYLVIDRSGNTENVYFMNLVDEADLLALIEDEDGQNKAPVCSCSEKCAVGSINTTCEVCRSNMTECAGRVPVTEPEPTVELTEPVEEPKSSNPMGVILLLALLGGGGYFAYIKFFKDKPSTRGNADLDDYDYGDEDEEDIPWEREEDEAVAGEDSEDAAQ